MENAPARLLSAAIVLGLMSIWTGASVAQNRPGPPTASAPAPIQIPPDLLNPNVEISYTQPTTAALRPIYERVTQRKVLEELRAFLAPLRLSEKLKITMAECGNRRKMHYRPGGVVTICYEYVALIERYASGLPRNLQRK